MHLSSWRLGDDMGIDNLTGLTADLLATLMRNGWEVVQERNVINLHLPSRDGDSDYLITVTEVDQRLMNGVGYGESHDVPTPDVHYSDCPQGCCS